MFTTLFLFCVIGAMAGFATCPLFLPAFWLKQHERSPRDELLFAHAAVTAVFVFSAFILKGFL